MRAEGEGVCVVLRHVLCVRNFVLGGCFGRLGWMRSRLAFAAMLAIIGLIASPAIANAQQSLPVGYSTNGNNLNVTCGNSLGDTWITLCRDGGKCAKLPSEINPFIIGNEGSSGQDNIKFSETPADVTWRIRQVSVAVDGVSSQTSVPWQIPNDSGTATSSGGPISYGPVTEINQDGVTSDGQITIKQDAPADFYVLQYQVQCTALPPNSDKITLRLTKESNALGEFAVTATPSGPGNNSPVTETLTVDNLINGTGTSQTKVLEFTTPSANQSLDITLTEAELPAGWGAPSFSCNITHGDTTSSTSGNTITGLKQGDVADCTITNTYTPPADKISVQLQKFSNNPGTFNVSVTDGTNTNAADLVVADGSESSSIETLQFNPSNGPLSFTVFETTTLPEGVTTAISCSIQTDAGGTANATASGASLSNMEGGDLAYCSITNTYPPPEPETAQLTLQKVVINDGGGTAKPEDFTLSFSGYAASGSGVTGADAITNVLVPVGAYTFSETSVQGYTQASLSCNGVDATSGYTITAGTDSVTCTFTNKFKPTDPRMKEETDRFIHRRVDNLLTHGPDRARMLRRLREGDSLKDTGSLKDGPLKYSSGDMGGPRNGLMFGSGLNRLGVNGGASPFDDEAPRDVTNPNGETVRNPFFDSLAGQASKLGMSQNAFSFGTSLSQLREMSAQHEKAKQQKKLDAAGLGYADRQMASPYMVPRSGFDVWMEGHISRYNDDVGGVNRDGDFRILYVGADYLVAPGILIGALVQVDDTTEDLNQALNNERGSIDGTGWMAGPYIGIRLRDNLFFDARAAWGTSSNDIFMKDDENGARHGKFDTTRWLATATLTGNERFGNWRFSPQMGLAYGHEEYDTYRNSLNQTINGGEANIGRVTGAIEVGYQFRARNGTTIEPHASITGIYNFDTDDLVINGVQVQSDESRAKVEAGVLIMTQEGWGVRAAGHFDGIGGDDFSSYGGSLWVNVPLN